MSKPLPIFAGLGIAVLFLAMNGPANGQVQDPNPPAPGKDNGFKGSVQQPPPVARKEHPLYSSLRDVISEGVTLFNDKGDHAGCYRLFQGALIGIRPFLVNDPELARHVDESLKSAEKLPRVVDRAFALRGVIDSVRDYYRPPGAKPSRPLTGTDPGVGPAKKPVETIPEPKKLDKQLDGKPGSSFDDKKDVPSDDKKPNENGAVEEPISADAKTEPAILGALLMKTMRNQSKANEKEPVVAYVHGKIPITRAEFGEYLIARAGPERIEALVNRRIIELACREKEIFVSDIEVDLQINEDLKKLGVGAGNMTQKEFADIILKRFNKTMYEWKEDIVRPRLAVGKLAKLSVKVEEEDIRKAFEKKFGPKVECRMIVMRGDDKANWGKIRDEVAADGEVFAKVARSAIQIIDTLRDNGGKVPAIHKHFGDANIEKAVFALKVGEVSQAIELPDGTAVIIKCTKHIAADDDVKLENVRASLTSEVMEAKIATRIPEILKELRKEAAPVILIGK